MNPTPETPVAAAPSPQSLSATYGINGTQPPIPGYLSATRQGDILTLSYFMQQGYVFHIEVANDLRPPVAWSDALTVTGNGTVFSQDFPIGPTNQFYRVAVLEGATGVYSLNVVGCINLPVSSGFNLVSDPLAPFGFGVQAILTNVVDGTKLAVGGLQESDYGQSSGWSDPNVIFGSAVLFSPQAVSYTLLGNVLSGSLTNFIPAGLSLCSSAAPWAGGLTSVLDFPAENGDQIWTYDPSSQSYRYFYYAGGWQPTEPTLQVGESFWVQTTSPKTWVQDLSELGGTGESFMNGSPDADPFAVPTITAQPQGQTNLMGDNVTFTMAATGAPPLTYQWQFDGTNLPGAVETNLTLTNLQLSNSGNYTAIVSDAYGSATSEVAVVTVLPPPTPPVITSSSVGGNMLVLSFLAQSGYDYQVQVATNLVPPVAWTDVPGAPTFSGTFFQFVLPIASSMNAFYRVSVNNTVYSSNIVGYVNLPVDAGYNYNLIANQLEAMSPSITNVLASVTNYSRLLEVSGNSFVESDYHPSLGWTDPNLTLAPGTGAIFSSFQGILTFVGVVPQEAPTNQIPAGLSLCSPIEPLAGGITSALGFQPDEGDKVYFYDTNSQSYSNPYVFTAGAWSPSEPVVGIGEAFWIWATNSTAGGYVKAIPYSGGANSLVPPVFGTAPSITVEPRSQSVLVGSNVVFSVAAEGTAPLTYQWAFNGANIADATNSVLALTNVQPSDAGNYSVQVSNMVDSATSTVATLTVITPCLSIVTDSNTYGMDGALAVHVQTYDCASTNPLPNLPVLVSIRTGGTLRTNLVTTDSSGLATLYFEPLAGEAGQYEISAALPGQSVATAESAFDIVGVGFNTNELTQRLIVGEPITNTIAIHNLTDVPLSDVVAKVVDVPTNLTVRASTSSTLSANGTNTVTYVLEAAAAASSAIQCRLQIASAEGAVNSLPLST